MSRKPKPRRFNVSVVEVLLHRACIEAVSEQEAIFRAAQHWAEDGPEAFHAETLGRSDLILADEETP